jgi:hypothetical protein
LAQGLADAGEDFGAGLAQSSLSRLTKSLKDRFGVLG